MAKAKQYGATPATPLPLGGKSHYKLDSWMRDKVPLSPEGQLMRLHVGGKTPEAEKQKLRQETMSTFEQMRTYLDPEMVDDMQKGVVEKFDNLAKAAVPRPAIPNAQRQFTGLLSGMRDDAAIARAAQGRKR